MSVPFSSAVCFSLAFLLTAQAGLASGFKRPKGSAAGMGRSYSGEAAIADDASVLASNPAGLLLLPDGTSLAAGLVMTIPEIDFDGSALTPAPVIVGGDNVVEPSYIPYLYGAHRLNEKWSVGVGVFSGYGLETDYPSGAQLTDRTELTTWNISPAFAYRVANGITMGAGLDIIRAEMEMTSTGMTRILDVDGDDWGVGFNIGALWEVSDRTRLGLHYRSQVDLDLEGSGSFTPGGLTGSSEVEISLPDTIEFSVYHQLTDRIALHGDVLWTNWEDFDDLSPSIGGTRAFRTNHDWENTIRYGLGATWQALDKLTVRVGAAFEETPIPGRPETTLRIPYGKGWWLSGGLSYQLMEDVVLDLGYTRVIADDLQQDEPAGGNGNFVGETEGHLNLMAFGLSGSF